ncbi:MAG TPA: alpha/beta fold hydrolase [Aggregatilineales bacterium]|nr:alpha/beta fold hydrolase [Aggregatilineales bacterium]HPV07463.1 alpha/beta fold hydrolase [Aggregatilineales bacterium]HQA69561.1 alpha/beta fold hydrolase [Aggregatilineales bacterium]
MTPRANGAARLRLFCLPHAGGGASTYHTWAGLLPPDVEVCAVQLPGRETRISEPPMTDLPSLVEALAGALLPCLDRPFALFGHSMGALLGFELARVLEAQGLRAERLFVSAHRAPHLPDRDEPISTLPEPDFLNEIRRLNGTPPEVLADDELRALVLPVLRADFAMIEAYTYREGEPLSSPITALGGLADGSVTREELEAWGAHTRAGFVVRMFPGDHFYIQSARPLLMQIIARELLLG